MKKSLIWASILSLANVGCASERLHVKVMDDEGHPISNAMVKVVYTDNKVVFANGRICRAEAKSNEKGEAIVRFNCKSSGFVWSAKAEGFYSSNFHKEQFKSEIVTIPPMFYNVVLHEHEKYGKVTLYRRKDPQPMYAYTREMEVKSPVANGRYGFDLQCFDWLPPHGKGRIADFYYVRERPDETNVMKKVRYDKSGFLQFKKGEPGYPCFGDTIGHIEFDENCGAYVGKKTGCESFPSVHCADVSHEFLRSFPIAITNCDEFGVWLYESPVIERDEYMVIRSRVKYDENGKVISSNYSKILGPFGLRYSVGVEESVFNPRSNDTNLEFDPKRNLYQGKKGRGMIP